MTAYRFGPLFRFIPAALGSAMARIVSGVNKVLARNIPVEYSADDPDKIGGYSKFWFVGRTALIHSDPNNSGGVITYNGMTFSLPYPNVLVAHVANGVLYFAALASGNHLHVYGIDLTGATASSEIQDPSDRITELFTVNASTGVVTVYYWDQVTGLQDSYTDSVSARGTRSMLIPAFSYAGDELYYGYSNVSTWVADAFKFTIDTIDWSAETLAILQANPSYPQNLTKQIALNEIILSTWDGGRTAYGPANEPLPGTNSPGNVGQIPEIQSGAPTGAYTYADPISAEYAATSYGSTVMEYGRTLEDLADEIVASSTPNHVYELIDTTSFNDIAYETVPASYPDVYGLNAFGDGIYIDPLTHRLAKIKHTEYDAGDLSFIGEEFIYVSSYRALMIYEFTIRPFLSTATLYPNGINGVSGQEPVGWCLNPDTNAIEQAYYEEISGTNTAVTKSGSRPVNGLYSFWPGTNEIILNADALADLEANRPALSGGDYSYSVTGETKITRGFYIGSELQYEIYSGNENISNLTEFTGSSYTHTATASTSTGGTGTITTAGNAVAQNVIGAAISSGNTYIRQKMENLHARAYALVRWAESVWTGDDTLRSITQTLLAVSGGVHTVVDEPFLMVSDISASFTGSNVSGNYEQNDIAPLNMNGDCLFSLYWHYIDDYPGTVETVSPYVNQKLFTSAGDNITSVDFNGTVVSLASLNTAYPGSGATPMVLEIVG